MVTGNVQSLERAIDIMMVLADGPRTLTEVSRATGLSKGTAFRLLSTLRHLHMVIKSPVGNDYMLGPGVLRLINGAILGVGAFIGVAKEPLESLWRETGETICVHVRVGMERICVHEMASKQPVRYVAEVGATVPLTTGSASKILLAYSDPVERAWVLATLTEPGNATSFERELKSIQTKGWADSVGERVAGAAAISVPIRGPGNFLASLSILGPADRLTRTRRLELLPLMRQTMESVEQILELAGNGPASPAAATMPPNVV